MRAKKALINTVVMILYQLVAAICGLILPRVLLTYFGSNVNGIVSSVSQFLEFISILRLGVAGATRVALYRSLADGDDEKTSGIVLATQKYMNKVAIALIFYIAVLSIAFPFIIDTSMTRPQVAAIVAIVGIGTFANYFFGITYQTLLDADQKEYVYYAFNIVTTILNTFIGVILCDAGFSVFVVKLGSSILYFLNPLILSIYVKKKYRLNKNAEPDMSALKNRGPVMAQSIANIVHENTDVVVLTLFSTMETVSIYTVYYKVVALLNKVMSVFTNSLEAAFGNMFAKNEYESIDRNLCGFEFFVSAFVSVIFSCSLVLILPFISLYTAGVDDAEYYQPLFAVLALLAQAMQCYRQPYKTVVQAAGKYKETQNGAIAEAALNITISILSVFKFGLIGVTIGTLVATTFRTMQYVKYVSNDFLGRSMFKSFGRMIWGFANAVVAILTFEMLPFGFHYTSWVEWIVAAFVMVGISVVITGLSTMIFYRKDFYYFVHLFIKSKHKA